MRPEISAFPSLHFYGGKIANGENVFQQSYTSSVVQQNRLRAYTFMQVRGTENRHPSGSFQNVAEAHAVVNFLCRMKHDALRLGITRNWASVEKLRVITFYQAQVGLLKTLLAKRGLKEVVVTTVDSSQGCEAEIVVISFVRGSSDHVGFLADDRRLNVALTRAQYQLILVGDAVGMTKLKNSLTMKALVADAQQRCCIYSDETQKRKSQYKQGHKRQQRGKGLNPRKKQKLESTGIKRKPGTR
uniref:DNA2/NAM7 helicase-like C-terminal domain-containing protein n=1 Tax=Cyclophora tenuis TaxID=216820 RepID=A0A7S1DB11_CYCTE